MGEPSASPPPAPKIWNHVLGVNLALSPSGNWTAETGDVHCSEVHRQRPGARAADRATLGQLKHLSTK